MYKKLGEVCSSIKDGSHNPPKGCSFSEYIMISSQNIFNEELRLEDVRYLGYDDFIIEDKRTNLRAGDVLLTIVGTIGRCYVFKGNEGNITLQRSVAVLSPKDFIDSRFLMYSLRGKNQVLVDEAHGIAQKGIYLKQLSSLEISYPNVSTQQQIVSELDLLSHILDQKRQQLKEYDALAESIFYDMFGDPVENPKGWEVKKLRAVSKFFNGKAHENSIDEDGAFILVNAKFIASSGSIVKRTNIQLFPLVKNDIVMVMSDVPNGKALARCYLVEEDNKYTLNQRICAFRGYTENSIYMLWLLNRNEYFLSFNDGNGQTNLRKEEVLDCPLPLPPLTLQRSFAAKIESIEHQKQLLRASIKETEMLFQSRMDYWFNG